MPRRDESPAEREPEEQNGSENGEEEEEYEIEAVLDAKRNKFPEGRMGYFVKWKGYPDEENSWVDERDAANAQELVDEYWRTKKRPPPRKSLEKKKSVPPGGDESDATKKKRGRPSAKPASEDEMDVDPPTKKAKKGRKARAESELEVDEDAAVIKTMEAYMNVDSWEHLIKKVDTVERDENDTLYIYFTLKSGEAVREKSSVCKTRFPRMLLDFYEDNLRWRTANEAD